MKRWLKENRGFLLFLLCFGFFRSAMADWNSIPSSSMRPTLLEGDVVLVNRLAYDLKVPLTDVSDSPRMRADSCGAWNPVEFSASAKSR